MNVASTASGRWAVSTRSLGEVMTAGFSTPALEIALLGVPTGYSEGEAESWLQDLAGVAVETSRSDPRVRAIPSLLHHALTGLLFSQSELWTQPGRHAPCSAAFVDTGEHAGFGFVGDARVTVLVEGQPIEPQWVIVRDQDGREARAAVLPTDRMAQIELAYGPADDPSQSALIEAYWFVRESATPAPVVVDTAVPATVDVAPLAESAAPPAAPAPVTEPEPVAFAAPEAPAAPALPESLPSQQPSLANEPVAHEAGWMLPPETAEPEPQADPFAGVRGVPLDAVADLEPIADTGETFAAAPPPEPVAPVADAPGLDPEALAAAESLSAPRPTGHPVGRWLGKLLGFGRKREPKPVEPEVAPVSTYDALLSESVPAETLDTAEQTAFVLPDVPPPLPVEPVSDFDDTYVLEAAADFRPGQAAEMAEAAEPPAEAHAFDVAAPLEIEPAPASRDDESRHARTVRQMSEIDAATLPVLPAPTVPVATTEPVVVEHEPVGADTTFAIPPVPVRPEPVVNAAPVAAPEPPTGPPVLRVTPPASAATASPTLEPLGAQAAPPLRPEPARPVAHEPPPGAAPPVLRVEPVPVPPQAIVPTPPVAPQGAPEAGFAPTLAPNDPIEEGLLIARPRAPRADWPVLDDAPRRRKGPSRRTWITVAIVAGVFGVGWLVGALTSPREPGEPGPFAKALRAIGIAAPHYVATVNSSPNGAWISVDGRDIARRTPADVELPPGAHTLTLTLPDLGSAQVQVRGQNGEKVAVEPSLDGSLAVDTSDPDTPINVALDGKPMGYLPLRVESLPPGLHELRFTGPGMPAWAQTVQVGVRQAAEVMARPMSAPATGVVKVQATLNDEQGSTPLSGAQVFVDGQLRGVTPASLELPRGPHSLKLTWHGETAPVQVIDLPGGNERFASFGFGLESPSPQVSLLNGVHPSTPEQQVMVSAAVSGLRLADIREGWLHVSTPDGLWRRYPMTAMRGQHGPVLAAVFPPAAFDAHGNARWYVSTATMQGDEYFSEIQAASTAAGRAARGE